MSCILYPPGNPCLYYQSTCQLRAECQPCLCRYCSVQREYSPRLSGLISTHGVNDPSGWKQHPPVNGVDDDGDDQQSQCSGRPLADGQRPTGGSAQDVERGCTHPVDSETWDGHRGQSLPHEGVHHSHGHPGAAACSRAWHLRGTRETQPGRSRVRKPCGQAA